MSTEEAKLWEILQRQQDSLITGPFWGQRRARQVRASNCDVVMGWGARLQEAGSRRARVPSGRKEMGAGNPLSHGRMTDGHELRLGVSEGLQEKTCKETKARGQGRGWAASAVWQGVHFPLGS